MKLNEGEIICDRCNGTGNEPGKIICSKCRGEGKIDWIDNIFNGKREGSCYYIKPGVYANEIDFSVYFPNSSIKTSGSVT